VQRQLRRRDGVRRRPSRLIEYAKSRGLRGFTADVLSANEGMLRVFETTGCRVERKVVSGTYEVTILFDAEP
jgi:hypothetical protein